MGRILAIDYGKKRSGIAVTDELKLIASGLTTVETNTLITFLSDYLSKEQVETVVIGLPKRLHNEESEIESSIVEFIRLISKKFPDLKIDRFDERFTSKMAFQSIIDSGLKRKDRRNKALVDEVAATIILQDYLKASS